MRHVETWSPFLQQNISSQISPIRSPHVHSFSPKSPTPITQKILRKSSEKPPKTELKDPNNPPKTPEKKSAENPNQHGHWAPLPPPPPPGSPWPPGPQPGLEPGPPAAPPARSWESMALATVDMGGFHKYMVNVG